MMLQRNFPRSARQAALSLVALAICLLGSVGLAAGAHPAATPHRGGTLIARAVFGLACLDPLKPGSDLSVVGPVYDTLVTLDERGRIRPGLAQRWTFSHGGKWFTLAIRHGVRFTDGNQFDATTVRQILNLYLKSPTVVSLQPIIHRIETPDRYTVRLVLNQPLRLLVDKLALPGFPMIDPKSELQAGAESCARPPAGTGPLMLKGYTPGFSEITFVRNPRYRWGPPWLHNKGPAYVSKLVIRPIVSDATAVSSLLSGDLDITRMPSTELGRVRGNAAIHLHTFYENAEFYLGFNAWHPPFENAAVRRAFAQAIDGRTLLKVANAGYGKVAYSPIPPAVRFYDKNAKRYALKYDPKAARRTLAAHHVTGPFTLETNTIPAFATSAEVIQAELAQVGVQIKVITKDVPTEGADVAKGQFDLTVGIHRWNDLYADYHSRPAAAHGGVNWLVRPNKTQDSLIDKSRETINVRKAAKVYADLQRYMDRNATIVPLFSRQIILAARSSVKGWHMGGTDDPLSYPMFQDIYVTR